MVYCQVNTMNTRGAAVTYNELDARALTLWHVGSTPGDVLKNLRQELGLSLRQLAQRAGVSHGTIFQLENHPGEWDYIRVGTLRGLARALNVNLDYLFKVAIGKEPQDDDERASAIRAAEHLEVHPDWIVFPVYGSVSAGEVDPEPDLGDVAYVPREHLLRRGANPETVNIYRVNGDCMISTEATRIEKNYAPGDYIAVDRAKGYEIGDIVVAWWPDEEKLVIKRYGVERAFITLEPISPGAKRLTLPAEEDVNIIGPVVWRGG